MGFLVILTVPLVAVGGIAIEYKHNILVFTRCFHCGGPLLLILVESGTFSEAKQHFYIGWKLLWVLGGSWVYFEMQRIIFISRIKGERFKHTFSVFSESEPCACYRTESDSAFLDLGNPSQ